MTLDELYKQYGEFTFKVKLINQTLVRLENEIVKAMENETKKQNENNSDLT